MKLSKRIARRLYLAGLLTEARARTGLTLREAVAEMVAQQVPVTTQQLEAWEEGWTQPAASDLFVIALVYGCDPAQLLGDRAQGHGEPSEN